MTSSSPFTSHQSSAATPVSRQSFAVSPVSRQSYVAPAASRLSYVATTVSRHSYGAPVALRQPHATHHVPRQSHVASAALRARTFFTRELGHTEGTTNRDADTRVAHGGVQVPRIGATMSSVMGLFNPSNIESARAETVPRRATQPAQRPSGTAVNAGRQAETPPAATSRRSAVTHCAPIAHTTVDKSRRSLHSPSTHDGRMPSMEVSPKWASTTPRSRSPTSAGRARNRFEMILSNSMWRSMSVESLNAAASLEECYTKCVKCEKEMRALVAGVNAGQINPGKAKTTLALLESELCKLQGNGIDSVKTAHLVSGQDACKKLRKELTLKVERILNYMETIFPMLASRTSLYFANLGAANEAS